MTTKQKQLILAWYGLISPKDVDGIWGNQSRAATIALQGALGIEQDGDFGPNTTSEVLTAVFNGRKLNFDFVPDIYVGNKSDENTNVPTKTGTFWDEIEYFTRDEFKCQCGGRYCDGFPHEPQEAMVRLADGARRHFGKPAIVISGLRDPIHNRNEGGVDSSQHIYGEACDIQIPGVSAETLLNWFQSQPGVRYAYAINATNVHFDIPKGDR